MYIHSSNETVKRINVSKMANTSTSADNSTATRCNSRLITVLVQYKNKLYSMLTKTAINLWTVRNTNHTFLVSTASPRLWNHSLRLFLSVLSESLYFWLASARFFFCRFAIHHLFAARIKPPVWQYWRDLSPLNCPLRSGRMLSRTRSAFRTGSSPC